MVEGKGDQLPQGLTAADQGASIVTDVDLRRRRLCGRGGNSGLIAQGHLRDEDDERQTSPTGQPLSRRIQG
ncbi:MAG: hypothetical protein MZW92_46855 [Comamonadaceae bacterium]|nr:hypothetical protein [Comamonadaceae bacterium]